MGVCILNISESQSSDEGAERTLYDVSVLVDHQPFTFMVSVEDVGPVGEKLRVSNFVDKSYWDILDHNEDVIAEVCKLTFAVHAHRPLAFPVSLDEPQS